MSEPNLNPHLNEPERGESEILDALGVGFGPANMALAIAMEEAAEEPGGRELRRVFLEAKPRHCWHPGMLLENSLLQITVIKDLAMVRNPRSRFTFFNYLKEKGRLFEFLNLRDLYPTRIEFNDYLGWVGNELRDQVRIGRRVVAAEAIPDADGDGEVRLLRVTSVDVATGVREEHLTRSLVLATGGVPCFPDGVEVHPGGRAFHSQEFLSRLASDFPDRGAPYRFVVVGAGQSGAEIFHYLMNHYPNADVTATMRRFGYKPVDDSDFTNEIFFPHMVDLTHRLPEEKREKFIRSFRDVNYAVVDLPLIRKIYRALYDERVMGRQRARVRPFLELRSIREEESGAVAEYSDWLNEQTVELEADGIVLCTGYRWARNHPLLDQLGPYLEKEASGAYRIERDYRVLTKPGFHPQIFLQGFCEDTHGISETVLSLLPMRAQDILNGILGMAAGAGQGAGKGAVEEAAAAAVADGEPLVELEEVQIPRLDPEPEPGSEPELPLGPDLSLLAALPPKLGQETL